MTTEKTQVALLKLIDSIKGSLDSAQISELSGHVGAIHACDDAKLDNRIAQAIIIIGDAVAKVNNSRGFNYGLGLAAKALRSQPPIVELIDNREN